MRTTTLYLALLCATGLLTTLTHAEAKEPRIRVEDGWCPGTAKCTNPVYSEILNYVEATGGGPAKKPRSVTEVWYRTGWKAQAETLAKEELTGIGRVTIKELKTSDDADILVVVAGPSILSPSARWGPGYTLELVSNLETRLPEDESIGAFVALDDGSTVILADSRWWSVTPKGRGFATSHTEFVGGAVPFQDGFVVALSKEDEETGTLSLYSTRGKRSWSKSLAPLGPAGLAITKSGSLLVPGHHTDGSQSAAMASVDAFGKVGEVRYLDQLGEGVEATGDTERSFSLVHKQSPDWSIIESSAAGNVELVSYDYKAFQLEIAGIAVDPTGRVWIAGTVNGQDLPELFSHPNLPPPPSTCTMQNGFLARVATSGSKRKLDRLVYVGEQVSGIASVNGTFALAGSTPAVPKGPAEPDAECKLTAFVAGFLGTKPVWKADFPESSYVYRMAVSPKGDVVALGAKEEEDMADRSDGVLLHRIRATKAGSK